MELSEVVSRLTPKEMEDLLVGAYSKEDSGPFVVENIWPNAARGTKEVSIRYMGTMSHRRTITVGGPAPATEGQEVAL